MSTAYQPLGKAEALRQGLLVEAVVAIGAGVAARSGASVAFGLDSVVEIAAAGVLVWRLRAEAVGKDRDAVERVERTSGRFVGGALIALAGLVVAESAATLILRIEARP